MHWYTLRPQGHSVDWRVAKNMLFPPGPVERDRNHRYHLGSIALNNMAVSLLERADYAKALDAMKDSINLMKGFCRSSNDRGAPAVALLDERLDLASRMCLSIDCTPTAKTSSPRIYCRAHADAWHSFEPGALSGHGKGGGCSHQTRNLSHSHRRLSLWLW